MPTEPHTKPPSSDGPPDDQPPARPHLPEDVVVEHILTRVPAATVGRFRTVCRSWRDALTSDHFADAHRAARAAAAHAPEIAFFAPAPSAAGPARSNNHGTAFYTCKLNLTATKSNDNESASSSAAHELMTVGNICPDHLVLFGARPCRGLTLLHSQWSPSAYHVCNLSTGEHVSLPPCTPNCPYWIASAGLGFDPVAREHKVVRLYRDADERRPRCEVYGMRSGGWRPCAEQVPQLPAAVDWRYKDKHGRPPVFVDGCFYWHVDARAILSLAASTEEFSWVPAPGRRPVRSVRGLAELDGSLCAVVELDPRLRIKHREPELWTRAAAAAGSGGGSPPSWSMRCRIVLHSLPRTVRHGLLSGLSRTILPLATSIGGKILLATSFHEVYAYDPESGGAERVFSMNEFLDYTGSEAKVLLNVAMHEESVTGVRRHPVGSDGDGAMLKVKLGSSTLARREGHANYYCGPETLRAAIDNAIMYERNSQPMKRIM